MLPVTSRRQANKWANRAALALGRAASLVAVGCRIGLLHFADGGSGGPLGRTTMEDQLADMLRKAVTEEVKRQVTFYERQLGEIVGICRQLLEEAQRRDRDHQMVLTVLAKIDRQLTDIERRLGVDRTTSEVEPRQHRARDRQMAIEGLAEVQRLLD